MNGAPTGLQVWQQQMTNAVLEEKRRNEAAQAQHDAQLRKQKDEQDRARFATFTAQAKKAREADMAEGRTRGEELFGNEGLGRLSVGMTPEEKNAMQGGLIKDLDRTSQTNLRALRGIQGRQGIRGATAAAQQMGVLQDAARTEAGINRDVFLKDREMGRDAEKFNLGQAAKEKYGILTTEFGYAGLGQTDRSAVMTRMAGEEAAEVLREQARNQTKK